METNEAKRVKVYFNLHKKVWSVLHMTPKGWRLWMHTPALTLNDVQWKVSEAGRQRVIREKRKNVHAFGIGTFLPTITIRQDGCWEPVKYNPYEMGAFQVNGVPVFRSEQVRFNNRSVFACQSS